MIQHEPRPWRSFVALGDSFTEGLSDEIGPDGRHRGWADRLAARLSERVPEFAYANIAIRGRLAEQVLEEQVPVAEAMGADLASVAMGVNDALRRQFDLHRTATALERSVARLRAAGSDVILFAFGDPSRRTRLMGRVSQRILDYNSAVHAIADVHDCYLVDFWDVAAFDDDRLWDADGLHLSPLGHQLAADAAAHALGIADDSWLIPRAPDDPVPPIAYAAGLAAWGVRYLSPWVVRRVRGRSSGDGLEPKRPDLRPC